MSVSSGSSQVDHSARLPSVEDRRRAACAAMAQAPALIRFASRYTRSLQDAEDAYQRAMEIALVRAPVTEPLGFMAWLHTVVKHEALGMLRARRREATGSEDDLATVHAETVADDLGPEAIYEWRERYRALQDAMAGLTEAQRVCLMLQSAGASYARIAEITGFSARKVERSILEGRRELHAWEVGLAAGEVCDRLLPALERVASGESPAGERRMLRRHTRHCMPCRALLRTRRESREWMGALVPVGLLAGGTLTANPDPSPYLPYWDRVAGNAAVRVGQLVQIAMELPGTALGRIGAGTAAIALVGTASAPLVSDAVRGAGAERPALLAEATPTAARATADVARTAAAPTPAGATTVRSTPGDAAGPSTTGRGAQSTSVPARADRGASADPVTKGGARPGQPASGRRQVAAGRTPGVAPARRSRSEPASAGVAPERRTPDPPAQAPPVTVAVSAPVTPPPPPALQPPPPPAPTGPSPQELAAVFGP